MNKAGCWIGWRICQSAGLRCQSSSPIVGQLQSVLWRPTAPTTTIFSQSSRKFSSNIVGHVRRLHLTTTPVRPALSSLRFQIIPALRTRLIASRPPSRRGGRYQQTREQETRQREKVAEDEGTKPKNTPHEYPEAPEIKNKPLRDRLRSLVSPTLFTIFVTAGSIYYAQTWESPRDRLYPMIHQTDATIWTLIGMNVVVFLLWRVPIPFNWRMLNKYFISSTVNPNAFSMIGNAFSHQQTLHMFLNCYVLHSFGTQVCDDIGRGHFLGLYLSACVVSSLASLYYSVLFRTGAIHALGASGAIMAVLGAFVHEHPQAQLGIIFLPFLSLPAETAALAFGALEVAGMVFKWKFLDHMAHLSGLGYGYLYMMFMRDDFKKKKGGPERKKMIDGRWTWS